MRLKPGVLFENLYRKELEDQISSTKKIVTGGLFSIEIKLGNLHTLNKPDTKMGRVGTILITETEN